MFTAVDQCNRGKHFIKEEAERISLAELNLQAGEKAISTASFSTAALYLNSGIRLLQPEHWKDHYTLCLNLYHKCAESEY
eukprot:5570064-Ditylum_brightwellii.AAC.1